VRVRRLHLWRSRGGGRARGGGKAGRRRGKPAAARCGQPWRRPKVGDGWLCEREREGGRRALAGHVGRK
jgi:hypothetical protein